MMRTNFYRLEISQFPWEKGGTKCQGEPVCSSSLCRLCCPRPLAACPQGQPSYCVPLHHAPGKELCEKELGDVLVKPTCLGLGATVELRPLLGLHHSHDCDHAQPPTLVALATIPDISAWPQTCLNPVTCPAIMGLLADPDYCHWPCAGLPVASEATACPAAITPAMGHPCLCGAPCCSLTLQPRSSQRK